MTHSLCGLFFLISNDLGYKMVACTDAAAHCSSRFVGFFNLSVKAIISMGVGKEIAMHPLFKSFVLKEQIIRRTIEQAPLHFNIFSVFSSQWEI